MRSKHAWHMHMHCWHPWMHVHWVHACRRIYRAYGKEVTKREVKQRSSWTGLPMSTWINKPEANTVIPICTSYEEVKECLENNTLPAEVQEVRVPVCIVTNQQ